ncbi:hypothetical protein, partial [Salipiger thiooxidans]|uniref:hypothetical protein n=1 Tax=Salipiger thiooxidans TaxID=282683 RepID=UPI001A961CD1
RQLRCGPLLFCHRRRLVGSGKPLQAKAALGCSVGKPQFLRIIGFERRVRLEARPRLARSMLGALDPQTFILQWVSLKERYQRKLMYEYAVNQVGGTSLTCLHLSTQWSRKLMLLIGKP